MPPFTTTWSAADLDRVRRELLQVPLHHYFGIVIDAIEPGHGRAHFDVSDNTANVHGYLHGGVYYAVLDVAAYLGVAPLLNPGENAVTHDIHVSVMKPCTKGQTIELTGRVRRRGRSLIFCEADAHCDGKLVASARVTKSIVQDGSFAWRKT